MKATAIVGASPKKDRYAHMAQENLLERGYEVIPINPGYSEIDGLPTKTLGELATVDTVTLYVSARFQQGLEEELLRLRPRRVIFNPGTENPELKARLEQEGLVCLNACTLVLLRTGQYEKS